MSGGGNNTSSSDFRMYSKAVVTKTVNMSDSTYYKEFELELEAL